MAQRKLLKAKMNEKQLNFQRRMTGKSLTWSKVVQDTKDLDRTDVDQSNKQDEMNKLYSDITEKYNF